MHLVRQAGGLTDDPERQRLFVAQSLQVAADSRSLNLPLPQVVGKPDREGGRCLNVISILCNTARKRYLRVYLRRKASRCVLSMSRPLSMLVRLE